MTWQLISDFRPLVYNKRNWNPQPNIAGYNFPGFQRGVKTTRNEPDATENCIVRNCMIYSP